MGKEYVEREQVKDELLSWAVCIKHPEHLLKEDALCVIDTIPAARVMEEPKEYAYSYDINGGDADGKYVVEVSIVVSKEQIDALEKGKGLWEVLGNG